MKANLLSAHGYQGDAMNLPVADADAAAHYYVEKMGFAIVGRTDDPHKKVVLQRDAVRIALAENGGDPEQDGCAFYTDYLDVLKDEFAAAGLEKLGETKEETRTDGSRFKVFFVTAPDGLCYWFGQAI
jgi:catechol 2,3-dioxygenase-like lactoylglutathione lyase family enzyme